MQTEYPNVPSPAFLLEKAKLIRNLELIRGVANAANVQIILALKGFAMWPVFPLVGKYLNGATASSLNEARLIHEEMGVKAHSYAPAYLDGEFEDIIRHSSHITFNSLRQFHRFFPKVKESGAPISCGIRVNPEYSEVEVDLYNPSAPGSRLGILAEHLPEQLPAGIEGFHFHTLCESSSFELEKVLASFEAKFQKYFHQLKWVNFGGGHLMTRNGYDTEHLIGLLKSFKEKYPLEIILEPGSAIAWETGPLIATVLDIVENKDISTAILDVSFTAHMPDTLEMPYRPKIRGAVEKNPGTFAYRMGGVSCLAGDYMEAYHFDQPLEIGQRIILEDMMHYTMVKTTMFNGVKHPDIGILDENGNFELIRRFQYPDYKSRLG